jgi:hypothetical protein
MPAVTPAARTAQALHNVKKIYRGFRFRETRFSASPFHLRPSVSLNIITPIPDLT